MYRPPLSQSQPRRPARARPLSSCAPPFSPASLHLHPLHARSQRFRARQTLRPSALFPLRCHSQPSAIRAAGRRVRPSSRAASAPLHFYTKPLLHYQLTPPLCQPTAPSSLCLSPLPPLPLPAPEARRVCPLWPSSGPAPPPTECPRQKQPPSCLSCRPCRSIHLPRFIASARSNARHDAANGWRRRRPG